MTSPPLAPRPAPRWAARAVIPAIGALACLVYLAGGRLDIGTSAHDWIFTPALAPGKQLSFAIDVPNGHRLTPSTIAAEASLWIARGRRTALRDLAAVTSAATIVVFGAWLRATGLPVFAVAVAMLAMMMGSASWWRGVSWNGDALTPAMSAGALWAAWRARATRSGPTVAAIVLAIAALVDGQPHAGLITTVTSEFTALGLCLLAIGVATLLAAPAGRTLIIATVLIVGTLYGIRLTDIPLVLAGWAVVAVAVAWLQNALPAHTARVLATVVALVLIGAPALGRVRMSVLGADRNSSLAARAAHDLRPADLPPNTAMIAESRRVDAELRLQSITIVPQTADALDAALAAGTTLAAFPNAQAHLETLGFLFERDWFGNTPVGVLTGRTPCVDLVAGQPRDVTPLAATGAFILHGSTYGAAPGGALVTITNTPPARATAIEPRSIPFEAREDGGTTTIRVPRTGRNDAVTVTIDRSPASVTAVAEDASPVTLCPGALRSPFTLGRRPDVSAQLRMDDNSSFISGWHTVEADPDLFRWTGARESIVRVTMSSPGPVRITITATPAAMADRQPSVQLRVNRCVLPSRAMPQALSDYDWVAGRECWRGGTNELAIGVTPLVSPATLSASHDTRLLGARIGAIRLARLPPVLRP